MNPFDTSEYKISYLVGAGASAKALPTVKKTETTKGVADSLREFVLFLKGNHNISEENKSYIEQICIDTNWLADHTEKFGTPDTFAKFLYLQDRSQLQKLKNVLIFYFTVEQLINNKFDNRTLIFLTTVMQRENIFPTNIKILNWNYDFQFELASETFRNEEFHYSSSGSVHKPPLINYYPSLGYEFSVNNSTNSNEYSIVHMNGIAGFYFNANEGTILNLHFSSSPKDINELVNRIKIEKADRNTLFTFAWEKDTNSANLLRKRIEVARKIIAESDILIIIGYSFPFFNRSIDKEVFDELKISGKLKKIIYQDPYKTGEFLRKQFDLPENIEIQHVTETENYFVPNEL